MNIDLRAKVQSAYEKNYKKFLIIPVALLLISITVILIQYSKTGEFIHRDISLKGGLSVTINLAKDINFEDLESSLRTNFKDSDFVARKLTDFTTGQITGINIEISGTSEPELKKFLEEKLSVELTSENYSVEDVGAALGSSFFRDLIKSIIFAFLFMSIVVFAVYRKFIPALTVIFTAVTDIIATVAVVDLLGIKISTAGIAAFLLLIGYSIDSDMLLTTKMLRRKNSPAIYEMYNAIRTGLTMTVTTLAALILGLLFSNSIVIKQIFTITLIGLIIDIIATYLGNAPILLWYVKKNENK